MCIAHPAGRPREPKWGAYSGVFGRIRAAGGARATRPCGRRGRRLKPAAEYARRARARLSSCPASRCAPAETWGRDGHPVLPVPLLHTRFCNNLPELFCTWQCVSMCSRCSTPMVGSGRGVEDASFPRHPYHACLECPFRGARRRSSISCQVFCASNAWPGIYDRLSHGSNNPMVRLRVETVFLNLCLSSCAVLRSSRYWL